MIASFCFLPLLSAALLFSRLSPASLGQDKPRNKVSSILFCQRQAAKTKSIKQALYRTAKARQPTALPSPRGSQAGSQAHQAVRLRHRQCLCQCACGCGLRAAAVAVAASARKLVIRPRRENGNRFSRKGFYHLLVTFYHSKSALLEL